MLRVVLRRLAARGSGSSIGGTGGSDSTLSLFHPGSSFHKGESAPGTSRHSNKSSHPRAASSKEDGSPAETLLLNMDCRMIKCVLAQSSAPRSTFDFPDTAHVLRIDCATLAPGRRRRARTSGSAKGKRSTPLTLDSGPHANAMADVVLLGHIHATVLNHTRLHSTSSMAAATGSRTAAAVAAPPPAVVVLIETNLSFADAEVQQFVLNSTMHMHPLPTEIEVEVEDAVHGRTITHRVPTPPLTVLVLTAEKTAALRDAGVFKVPEETLVGRNPGPLPSPSPLSDSSANLPVMDGATLAAHKTSPRSPQPVAATPKTNSSSNKSASSVFHRGRQDVQLAVPPITPSTIQVSPASPSSPSPPPRAPSFSSPFAVNQVTEKLLWATQPGHPVPLRLLAPLVSSGVYANMRACASALRHKKNKNSSISGPNASPDALAMHLVVYRAGTQSTAQLVWFGAMLAAAQLASAIAGDQLTALDVALVTLISQVTSSSSASSSIVANNAAAGSHGEENAAERREAPWYAERTPPIDSVTGTQDTGDVAGEVPCVYVLIHTSLAPQDVAVLQRELTYWNTQLQIFPAAAAVVAGVGVLTSADVSSAQLQYVLQYGTFAATTPAPTRIEHSAPNNSSSSFRPSDNAVAAAQTFQEVYALLMEKPQLIKPALLTSGKPHPDALVLDTVRIAALTEVLVRRRVEELRQEWASTQQQQARTADSEAVARAAQKVELKTVVTEAVEEVSVRHEQATAHLVKTLSSVAGQWSLEKLSETLESVVREEVKPLMEVLETRLAEVASSASEHRQDEEEDEKKSTATPDAVAVATGEAVVKRQKEMQSMLAEMATQLRDVRGQNAAVMQFLKETGTAAAADAEEERKKKKSSAAAVDPLASAIKLMQASEARLVEKMTALQQQQQETLVRTVRELRQEVLVRPAPKEEKEAHQPAAITVTQDWMDGAVSTAVTQVRQSLRQDIESSVRTQLDNYCKAHRAHTKEAAETENDASALPVLPLTSLDLEEMMMRTVNDALRKSTEGMEKVMRAALESTLSVPLIPLPTAVAGTTSVSSSSTGKAAEGRALTACGLKGAVAELLDEVRAEAAEEAAEKQMRHNRQLHRFLLRRQHLQRAGRAAGMRRQRSTVADTTDTRAAPDADLSPLAIGEAVRAAMDPYMTRMQVTLAENALKTKRSAAGVSGVSSSERRES